MKIGFTGTQTGTNEYQKKEIIRFLDKYRPDEVHHGDCIGSDTDFHHLFCKWHCDNDSIDRRIVIHPPFIMTKASGLWLPDNQIEWRKMIKAKHSIICEVREPRPYLIRNEDIVNETEFLIATPKEFTHTLRSGTWKTIRHAWKHNKVVHIIPPLTKEHMK